MNDRKRNGLHAVLEPFCHLMSRVADQKMSAHVSSVEANSIQVVHGPPESCGLAAKASSALAFFFECASRFFPLLPNIGVMPYIR